MRALNVLLVDDNPNFLKAARDTLAAMPNVSRVDVARSASEALARAAVSRPDVVLTDIVMPEMSGFELIRNLRGLERPPHIVVVTLHEGLEFRAAAQRSGADMLVSKREFGARMSELIVLLADGTPNTDRRRPYGTPLPGVVAADRVRHNGGEAA